jgi:hypothetical protein
MRAPLSEWNELDGALRELGASGSIEVREDGEWLAELAGLQYEVHVKGKNALIHLWSDECNLTRRLVRVASRDEKQIVLEVQRFGKSKPGRIDFLLRDSDRTPLRITREQFRKRFERILADKFPDAAIGSLTSSQDLKNSFSGLYVRGTMHQGVRAWALIAAGPSEAGAVQDILAFGILWLDWCRNQAGKRAIEGLRLFVPERTSRPLRERALALSSTAKVEIFEMREPDSLMQRLDLADAGNLQGYLGPRSETETAVATARDAIARIRAMLPANSDAITLRVPAGTGQVAFCFYGMEFARRAREGIFFGLGKSVERMKAENESRLRKLLRDLDAHRRPLATDTNHRLYRGAPERWLESMIIEDPTRIDAVLDPKHFYSQVPALAAGDRGILDLLGITRHGRLVVIELKASEDIQMPLQAVDYWLRVRRHQREGDFQSHGYFAGVEIDPRPPLIWLVAPTFRFHSAMETRLKYLSPEIQTTRIGLNENWRQGIEVMLRQ